MDAPVVGVELKGKPSLREFIEAIMRAKKIRRAAQRQLYRALNNNRPIGENEIVAALTRRHPDWPADDISACTKDAMRAACNQRYRGI